MTDQELSVVTGIPVKVIAGIRYVESHGNVRAVRFEPHLFLKKRPDLAKVVPYTKGTNGAASHVAAETNRAAFDHAMTLDPQAAVESTSFGAFQDLGRHLLKATGLSPVDAVKAFDANPDSLSNKMFASWVKSNPRILEPARKNPPDFEGIAHAYNGCSDCTKYATRLREGYSKA